MPHASARAVHLYRMPVASPFRLDLTAALLRRFPATGPDTEWIDGAFICTWRSARGLTVATITQPDRTSLAVAFSGSALDAPSRLAQLRTMLGLTADLSAFHAAAAGIPWLHELDTRYCGVRPARTATVWEAGTTAIIHQSVSMLCAAAVVERCIDRIGARAVHLNLELKLYPTIDEVLATSDTALRATGLSAAKVTALRALGTALTASDWDDAQLAMLPTAALCERLTHIRGIGPWSAAVIALRAFGRLDVFPLRDSGVLRTIGALSNHAPDATDRAVRLLGPSRGMLYHYLLLARLDARGKLKNTGACRWPSAAERESI